MPQMRLTNISRRKKSIAGATMVEYGLGLALIVLIGVGGMKYFGVKQADYLCKIGGVFADTERWVQDGGKLSDSNFVIINGECKQAFGSSDDCEEGFECGG